MEDVRKKDTWKVERPPEILISLTPQQSTSMLDGDIGEKEKCLPCVTLHVTCPSDYPMALDSNLCYFLKKYCLRDSK